MFEDRDHVESELMRGGRGPAAPRRPEAPALRGAVVLIAEDRPEALAMMRRVFLSAGAVVRACDHPADAAEAISAAPECWDLLVTDFEMPHMDGAALASLARRAAPSLPIVLCSGLDRNSAELKRAAGLFDRILPKTIGEHGLLRAAAEALEASRR
jgi:CheY-like chemotaxis protein